MTVWFSEEDLLIKISMPLLFPRHLPYLKDVRLGSMIQEPIETDLMDSIQVAVQFYFNGGLKLEPIIHIMGSKSFI